MTETKLNHCPFCGSEAVILGEDDGMYQVVCPNCAANIDNYDYEKEVAAEKWNKRKIEYAQAAENKRLREALEVILDEAQKDEPCIMAIKVVAYTALKGENK